MSELTASMLLSPNVLDEPYDFYVTLRNRAPVWTVPGTGRAAASDQRTVASSSRR